MVLDAAKGVETQTRKLFAVCRMRGVPILTFINKMDLPTKEPLDLLQEVEDVLKIHASPINWPIGSGQRFKGVVYPGSREAILFARSEVGGAGRAGIERVKLDDVIARKILDDDELAKLQDDLELLEAAGNPYDHQKFLQGQVTPVFFGSALTNFGVEPFFDDFVRLAPPPHPYEATSVASAEKIQVDPVGTNFSGYVFKIQANMNPRHRDSMAFLRICSGEFTRDMTVRHHRSDKEVRLSRSYSMVAQDRNTVEHAYPGDIVGVINPGVFAIGDTVSIDGGFNFKPMPQFPPEVVAQLRPLDVLRHKSFEKGVMQLAHEGAVQILRSWKNPESSPYVAAVGKLQFEVLQYRLKDEYGVDTAIDLLPYRYSAYVVGDPATLKRPQSSLLALDALNRVVILFSAEWEKQYTREQNQSHQILDFSNA
jgi:peptide chain release factor 3